MPTVRSILVCPQEFKGSLTAFEAAHAIAEGARRALAAAGVTAGVIEAPMADGGPGTASIVVAATQWNEGGGSVHRTARRTPSGFVRPD